LAAGGGLHNGFGNLQISQAVFDSDCRQRVTSDHGLEMLHLNLYGINNVERPLFGLKR
jgi:hypothetical protein